jgi:predicted acylesterase/phospholipase RssA
MVLEMEARFDIHILQAWTRKVLGDLTFREAYTKSGGRILNIPVWSKRRSEVPVLLNWMTAPDVLVWSAACAACALPGLYEEVVLMMKDPATGQTTPWNPSAIRLESAKVVKYITHYRLDVNYELKIFSEVPLGRLTELFNANHFIVSHVPSFWSAGPRSSHPTPGQSFVSRLLRFISSEASHRMSQLASVGLLPSSIERLARFLRPPALGDIQIVPRIIFSDLGLLVNNPTPEFLNYSLLKGERAAWRRLSAVWIRCAIEFEIDRALQRARSQLEAKQ